MEQSIYCTLYSAESSVIVSGQHRHHHHHHRHLHHHRQRHHSHHLNHHHQHDGINITTTITTTYVTCKVLRTGWGLESGPAQVLLAGGASYTQADLRSVEFTCEHLSFHVGVFWVGLGQGKAPVFMGTFCSCFPQCDKSHVTDLFSGLAPESLEITTCPHGVLSGGPLLRAWGGPLMVSAHRCCICWAVAISRSG